MSNPICIIGSGQAGVSLARELRKLNTEIPIQIISADTGGFYSKPMLSNAYVKNMPLERLRMQTSEVLSDKINVTTRPNTRVTSINIDTKTLILEGPDSSKEKQAYSALVLATGAHPIKAPIPGLDKALVVNHIDDYIQLRQKIDAIQKDHCKIAIIGGGLVGCELANDLQRAGHRINLFEQEHQLLGRMASEPVSVLLQTQLEAIGVKVHTSCSVNEIKDDNTIKTEQEEFAVDFVISAIGLTPSVALAKENGLDVNKGILCDLSLRTSAKDVYALGDCCEVQGLVLPYILPIMEGAKVLANLLLGEKAELKYPCMPVAVKTTDCPLVLCPPLHESLQKKPLEITEQHFQSETSIKTLYMLEDNLVGFCLAGDAVKERQTLQGQTLSLLEQLEL